jgi:hypothetical protein
MSAGAGKLEMTFTPASGGSPVKYEIFEFDGAGGCDEGHGVVMAGKWGSE